MGRNGATVFGERDTTVLSNAIVATEPPPVEKRPYWCGDSDPRWPYYAKHDAVGRDQHGQFLEGPSCSCSDASHLERLSKSLQRYVAGHAHSFRVVCPACHWFARVKDDGTYPIPIHGGVNNNCSGVYTLVKGELYAVELWGGGGHEPFDPTPAQWRVYNAWTGRHVCDVQGTESPNIDRAFMFPSEADAVQFVKQTQGTEIAKALTQPRPDGELPLCTWCGKHYPLGTPECANCISTVQNNAPHLLAHVRGEFYTGERYWVYVTPCNTKGQTVAAAIGF